MEPTSLGRRMLVFALVAAAMAGAGAAIAFTADDVHGALSRHAGRLAAFLAAAVALQLLSVRVPGRGSVSVSGAALVGAAIALGAGPAMAIAGATALAQWLRSRGLAHRALFDTANYVLSAGAAGAVFHALAGAGGGARLAAALVAGLAYTVANHVLLCAVMGLSESRSPFAIWRDRFSWAGLHFLAFGALGLLAATADAQLGAVALLAFLVPPLLLAHSMRATLERVHRLRGSETPALASTSVAVQAGAGARAGTRVSATYTESPVAATGKGYTDGTERFTGSIEGRAWRQTGS
jgi:hypothetical protein